MKSFKLLILATIVVLGGLFVWYQIQSGPVNAKDMSQKIFIIQKGEGTRSIAKNLKQQGLIRDEMVFIFTVKRLGIENRIQAGDFRLSPSMKTEAIAKELTHGALDRWVTVIEGWRAEEIADVLKTEIETYEPNWILELKKKEGYLFPDTYLIPKDADIAFIVSMFENNFNSKITQKMRDDLKSNGRTLNDAVILASLIEREAKFSDDRPRVASVLFNRLDLGMKLDIDATVQYAVGYQANTKSWWKEALTNNDLQINSPYNTYRFAGLPPKPIASPGLSAIEAAIYLDETNNLYYVSDKNGHLHFAETFEGHQENIEKYLQ